MRRGRPMGGRVPGPGVSGGTEPVTAEQMWAEFASGRGLDNTPYEAWAYGGDADALAQLTLAGKKTATSSALPLYRLKNRRSSRKQMLINKLKLLLNLKVKKLTCVQLLPVRKQL